MNRGKFGVWACGLLVAAGMGRSAAGQLVVERQIRPMPTPAARSYEVREVAVDARVFTLRPTASTKWTKP